MNNQEYKLEKYYNEIDSLFILFWYGLPMTLVTFDAMNGYWIFFFIAAIKPINSIIEKQIKQYCI